MAVIASPWIEVKGIFTGGCVERGEGSSFRATAHAHTEEPYKGWICVRAAKRVWTASGQPSRILLHEYAHILSGTGHDAKWGAIMAELGQPWPKWYAKRFPGATAAYRRVKREKRG